MSIEQKRLESCCMPPLPGSSQILARPNTQQKKGELPQRTRNQIYKTTDILHFGKLAFAVSIGHLQSHRSGQSRSRHAKVSPRKPKQTSVGKDSLRLAISSASWPWFLESPQGSFLRKNWPKEHETPWTIGHKKAALGPSQLLPTERHTIIGILFGR